MLFGTKLKYNILLQRLITLWPEECPNIPDDYDIGTIVDFIDFSDNFSESDESIFFSDDSWDDEN